MITKNADLHSGNGLKKLIFYRKKKQFNHRQNSQKFNFEPIIYLSNGIFKIVWTVKYFHHLKEYI